MKKLMLIIVVLGLTAFVLAGCAHNPQFNIRISGTNDLEFSGSYLAVMSNGQTDSKSINATIPCEIAIVGIDGIAVSTVSVEFQKQAEEGTLKVEILKNDEVIASSETVAPYGVMSLATE
jgi:hypothetical protein